MNILGIETSTKVCAVALWQDGEIIAEYTHAQKKIHAEIITTLVENLCKNAQVKLSEINGIGVSIGPGSFTGLRIGLAFAKGFAFSADIPVLGISTTDAIVSGIPQVDERVAVLLPSRKGELYAALYHWQGDSYMLKKGPDSLSIENYFDWSENTKSVLGPGWRHFGQGKREKYKMIKLPFDGLTGRNVAELAAAKINNGERDDLDALEPQYIKPFFTTAKKVAIS